MTSANKEEAVPKGLFVKHRSYESFDPCSSRVLLAAVAAVAVAALVVSAALMASKPAETPVDPAQRAVAVEDVTSEGEAAKPAPATYVDTGGDPLAFAAAASQVLDGASGTPSINLFDAAGVDRAVDASELPAVADALAAFDAAGCEAGFVVFDLGTGRGLGCNADLSVFSASTIKAPFVAFVAQSLVDNGLALLDDQIEEDITVAGTGIMADDDEVSYDLETVLYNTIVHSDNTGYALLRENYGGGGFEAWAQAVGVDAASWEGEWYPFYSPRDLAKLWLDVGAYLATGDGASTLCKGLLSQSGNSFLRQALGGKHDVVSKPGFEIDEGSSGYSMSALNDAGIVSGDSGTYLVAVMSTADYDDEYFTVNQPLVTNLFAALGDAHDMLLANEVPA